MKMDINQLIINADILVFDLDGVIVNSDKANFLAYREAICAVKNIDLYSIHSKKERFTKDSLLKLKNLTILEYNKIIKLKSIIFHKYADFLSINKQILKIIKENQKSKEIILATNATKYRADFILKYFNIENLFNKKFYKEDYNDMNKYEYMEKQGYQNMLIFEDNITMITNKNLNYILIKGK